MAHGAKGFVDVRVVQSLQRLPAQTALEDSLEPNSGEEDAKKCKMARGSGTHGHRLGQMSPSFFGKRLFPFFAFELQNHSIL